MPKPRIYGAKARAAKKAKERLSAPASSAVLSGIRALYAMLATHVAGENRRALDQRGIYRDTADIIVKLTALAAKQDEIAKDIEQIQRYVGVLATQALAIDDAAKRARADQYRRSIPTLLANAEFDMDT